MVTSTVLSRMFKKIPVYTEKETLRFIRLLTFKRKYSDNPEALRKTLEEIKVAVDTRLNHVKGNK